MLELQDFLSIISGSLVGFVLGLVGGGGSIIAVPLLLYVVGIGSPHLAIGTSAIAVSLSAASNLVNHARKGMVKWPCAVTFSLAGVAGAWAGSSVAMKVPGQHLMALFGALMVVVGVVMLLRKDAEGNPGIRLNVGNARELLPLLLLIGFSVGALSGFFGIGGGFLIVPGLMLATGMPIAYAIGTSLVAVTVFGATTASNYALSGLVDWRIAGLFIGGGVLGGIIGTFAGHRLGKSKGTLSMIFAVFVILIGAYVVWKGLSPLIAA
ncbi:sulfite exporter TauE/SafE family protein [Aestuariivirga sp.]|uniref:sulfite exporter TauE/SafE family protein n=1 Tax=Aestuariivirga sp. TaxID=2650926 RepID=UPI003594842D